MALTREQFEKARKAGFSVEQIAGFEKKRTPDAEQKKEVWKIQTPEELVGQGYKPWQAGLLATGQQLSKPVFEGVDAALLGLPRKALKTHGLSVPETEIQALGQNIEPALSGAARVKGFISGAPMTAGRAIASGIKGAGLLKATAQGAVELGTAAALVTPPEESFKDWKSRAKRTSGGVVLGGALGAAGYGVKSLSDLISRETKIAESVRSALKGKHAEKSPNFEGSLYDVALKSNNKKINLSKDISFLNRESRDALEVMGRKSRKMAEVLRNPENVTLKQFQDAINEGKEVLSKSKLSGKGLRASDKVVDNMINKLQSIKYREFPEMKFVDNTYKEISENLSVLDKALKKGSTISTIRSAFKDAEKKEVLRELVDPELFNQLSRFVTTEKFVKGGVGLVAMYLKYGIIYKALQRTFGKINIGGGDEEVTAAHTMGAH